jgi:hypothetical protein
MVNLLVIPGLVNEWCLIIVLRCRGMPAGKPWFNLCNPESKDYREIANDVCLSAIPKIFYMINYDQAKEIVLLKIQEISQKGVYKLVLLENKTITLEDGWVFFYYPEEGLKNSAMRFGGGGPLISEQERWLGYSNSFEKERPILH